MKDLRESILGKTTNVPFIDEFVGMLNNKKYKKLVKDEKIFEIHLDLWDDNDASISMDTSYFKWLFEVIVNPNGTVSIIGNIAETANPDLNDCIEEMLQQSFVNEFSLDNQVVSSPEDIELTIEEMFNQMDQKEYFAKINKIVKLMRTVEKAMDDTEDDGTQYIAQKMLEVMARRYA